MRIWMSEADYDLPACAVALGTFDGVHLGHQALIRRTLDLAAELGVAGIVYTFDRHPLSVLCPERAPRELLSLQGKLDKLDRLGVEGVLLKAFTPEFVAIQPEAFLEMLVQTLHARAILAGFNYSFGAGGRGNAQFIRAEASRLGYRAEIVDAVCDGNDTISSTLIRHLIQQGDVGRARRLLGS